MQTRNVPNLLSKSVKALRESLGPAAKQKICTRKKDIVIEGYPRSGNTFTMDMLNILQENSEKKLDIAHHTHRIENVILGRKLGVPTIVLLRRPEDAILSYKIFSGRDVAFSANRYYMFYDAIDQLETPPVIVDFETVVSDFNAVVGIVNRLAGADIPRSPDLAADTKRAHAKAAARAEVRHKGNVSERIGAPNAEREAMKAQYRAEVADFLLVHPDVSALYERINAKKALQ